MSGLGLPYFPVSETEAARLIHAVKADASPCTLPSQAATDEPTLLDRLRRGDRAALEVLIAEHEPMVRRLVSRLTGWSGDIDDLVQDVFVRAIENVNRFKGGSTLSTWLTRIAINACRSHQRKRVFRISFWLRRNREMLDLDEQDAFASAEQRENVERVTIAVRKLKGIYREVIVLHYLEERSTPEIQELLGVSRSTVEVRLHRARKMLEAMLIHER